MMINEIKHQGIESHPCTERPVLHLRPIKVNATAKIERIAIKVEKRSSSFTTCLNRESMRGRSLEANEFLPSWGKHQPFPVTPVESSVENTSVGRSSLDDLDNCRVEPPLPMDV
jgi:hypothetical protein